MLKKIARWLILLAIAFVLLAIVNTIYRLDFTTAALTLFVYLVLSIIGIFII